MDGIGQELFHAARRLRRSPAFTLAAVSTLALAIGANTSIFAVVQRVILNPLPYPDSDELIGIEHGAINLKVLSGFGTTPGLYFHYQERARTLDAIAVYRAIDETITGDGEPERIRVTRATPSLDAVLQVRPAIGRWFTDEEGKPGAAAVMVISNSLWQRRYGADPGILGRRVVLGGVPIEVIGVMPATYAFPDRRVDAWVADQITRARGFGLWGYSGVARMRDGVTLERARSELQGLLADLPAAFPGDAGAIGNYETRLVFSGRTLKEATIGSVERALWILLASVGLVLLVACANVANLFLVRSEARQRDVAVRRALGASPLRIARYHLAESVWLATAGGAIGLSIAWAAVRTVVAAGPANLPRLDEIHLDGTVVLFTATLTALAACVFGAVPLWRHRGLAATLHEIGRGTTASRHRHRARRVLMGAQVAMALVLLVSSGLMVRSFQRLRAIDPGFDPASALTFGIGLPDREYPDRAAAIAAHHAIIDRIAALPGVTRVSATTCLPFAGGCSGNTIRIEGRGLPQDASLPLALFRGVAGDYFETMGTRVLRGRGITRRDVERAEPIAVITESLGRRYFPDEDPIGKRVASNRPPPKTGGPPTLTWLEIVGIAANTPVQTLTESNALPLIFMPLSLGNVPGPVRGGMIGPDISLMTFVVRTSTSPLDVHLPARRAVGAFDRNLSLAQVRTLEDIFDRATSQMAFTMILLAIAAAVALMLGVIGIYGVMSYIVSQRTGEIGVRLALGAAPGSVAGQIVRQGGLVTLGGTAVGLATAFAGSRLIESLLYGVSPRDPGIFASTTLLLLAVALVACWLPARRAARLSPLDALRAD